MNCMFSCFQGKSEAVGKTVYRIFLCERSLMTDSLGSVKFAVTNATFALLNAVKTFLRKGWFIA